MKPAKGIDAGGEGTYHYRIEWLRSQPKSLWRRFRDFALEPREPSVIGRPPRPRIPAPPSLALCLACDEELKGRLLTGICARCKAAIRSFRFLSDPSFNDGLPQCSGAFMFPSPNGCKFKQGHSGPCEEERAEAGAPHA